MPVAFAAPPAQSRVNLREILDASASSSSSSPQIRTTTTSLDLQWAPFQHQVDVFLKAIDRYVADARTEIGARVTDHTDAMRELKAGKEEWERRINMERDREAQMLASVEAERHAVSELQSSLTHLQTTLSKVKDQSASIEQDLNAVKKETNSERTEKEKQKNELQEQKERDASDLALLEESLGIRIEGVEKDVLLLRFTLIDPSEPEREFSLVIDISKSDYSVPQCEPMIPTLGDLLSQLNADRQFFSFIKRVRKAFRALVPEPPKAPSRFDDMAGPGLRTPGSRRVLENGLEQMRLE